MISHVYKYCQANYTFEVFSIVTGLLFREILLATPLFFSIFSDCNKLPLKNINFSSKKYVLLYPYTKVSLKYPFQAFEG